jgi:hypothetical protein
MQVEALELRIPFSGFGVPGSSLEAGSKPA